MWLIKAQRVGVAGAPFAFICMSEFPFLPSDSAVYPRLGLQQGPGGPGEVRKGRREKEGPWSLGESLLRAAQVPPAQIKATRTPGAPIKPSSPGYAVSDPL